MEKVEEGGGGEKREGGDGRLVDGGAGGGGGLLQLAIDILLLGFCLADLLLKVCDACF